MRRVWWLVINSGMSTSTDCHTCRFLPAGPADRFLLEFATRKTEICLFLETFVMKFQITRGMLWFCILLLIRQPTVVIGYAVSSRLTTNRCYNYLSSGTDLSRINLCIRTKDEGYAMPRSRLHTLYDGKSSSAATVGMDTISTVRNVNQLFRRCTWISWWVQLVLSVISSVILVFANTVRQAGMKQSLWSSGFSFSVIGVVICLMNTFWTWNAGRLSARIVSRKIPESAVFPTMRRYCQISVITALVGMFITIISAEMIVGNLVSKTLLSSQVIGVVPVLSATGAAQNTLQALDIFLVQANTNALVAHFAPLSCYLFLQTQIPYKPVLVARDIPPTANEEKAV